MKNKIKKIFESQNYPRFMYLAIITTLLLNFFSFVSIINEANEISILGLAIDNVSQNDSLNNSNNEITGSEIVYSQTSYLAFYAMIITIIVVMTIVFLRLRAVTRYNMEKEKEMIWA